MIYARFKPRFKRRERLNRRKAAEGKANVAIACDNARFISPKECRRLSDSKLARGKEKSPRFTAKGLKIYLQSIKNDNAFGCRGLYRLIFKTSVVSAQQRYFTMNFFPFTITMPR